MAEKDSSCEKGAREISSLRPKVVDAKLVSGVQVRPDAPGSFAEIASKFSSPSHSPVQRDINIPTDGFSSFYDCVDSQVPAELSPELSSQLNDILQRLKALEECCNNPGSVVVPGGSTYPLTYSANNDGAISKGFQGTLTIPQGGTVTKIAYVIDINPGMGIGMNGTLQLRYQFPGEGEQVESVVSFNPGWGDNPPRHFEGIINLSKDIVDFAQINFRTITDIPGVEMYELAGTTSVTVFVGSTTLYRISR